MLARVPVLCLLAGVLIAAGAAPAGAQQVGGTTVVMSDTDFVPEALSVPVGATITWVNHGSNVHTATSIGGAPIAFTTGGVGPGQTASVGFGTPGAYYYTSSTDCLNGVQNPAGFPCGNSFLVQVGSPLPTPTPTTVPFIPNAAPYAAPGTVPAPAAPAPAPAPAPAAAPLAAAPIPGGGPDAELPVGHFFSQAAPGGSAGWGYRISNEGGIPMWSEFQRLGGVAALGYPVSRRFTLDGFVTQATQKVLLQWRPDMSPPQASFVNTFDKLHDMGQDGALQNTYQVPPQLDGGFDAGKSPDQAKADRLTLLNADPAIAARYNSGPSPELYNGLPTSTVTSEGPFFTVRAQRTAIQHWISDNPAAGVHRGDVTLVNGGEIAKALGLVPADAALPETIAGQVQAAAAPAPAPAAAAAGSAAPVVGVAWPWVWKPVGTSPIDCGASQIQLGWLPSHQIPCADNAPNSGTQYISGHVLQQNGAYVPGIVVRATAYGLNYDQGTDQDGYFSMVISTVCPIENRVYSLYVIDGQGRQSSNVYTVNYSNCNLAGEFHFDFIQTGT